MTHTINPGRREWLRRGLLAGFGLGLSAIPKAYAGDDEKPRPRVAVILTQCFYRSHAHVILENFLEPYYFNGKVIDPGVDVVSLYVDQFPDNDMIRDIAAAYEVPIFSTIPAALRVGQKQLAVDGVVSIGEHGRYPRNEKDQVLYPRKEFFDEIVAEFRRSGRSVPVFNDKHLSYRRDWAIEMVDVARELDFPFLAGSSVPLAQRRPTLELPAGAVIEGAVSIHGGPVESYDFHGLEVLQSVIEDRHGGETGVAEVRFLEGEALWNAAKAGEWSIELADAAMAAELGPGQPSVPELVKREPHNAPPHGILLTYRDGLKAIVLRIGSSGIRWNFACQIEGRREPLATSYYVGPWDNRNLFRALSHAIQRCIIDGEAPYPVERTLLATCVLDAAMDSRQAQGAAVTGDDLAIRYKAKNFTAMREMGATWDIITPETPQPPGIDTTARRRGG